ncbi:hypothetical protein [Agathobacter rectalis]|jgi:rubredoxin|uniref:Uncharacterized protein n=1 Tax=Agathobacter rectalis TaxID=39491 RepID=A0A3E4YK44_9FIRM|nr:hypothetical protein [Agathobacter rectalis]RGM75118.1 hypothetical protein DXB99_00890 [Agathobacter rectalis]RGT77421.1 hypothetical protein DWX07_04785 [Agathobacter rectalis]RGT82328.1 hypothetical protein DWX06_05150 [Agathobacter rectalis]RGZ90967.1 hypothetical protein DW967_10760 [Agathobacter rectalis]RHC39335.1 hypothetical protein DW848_08430 [Agathobacter rectalis]
MNNTRIYNNTNPLNINGISDDKTDCSRQSAFCGGTSFADLPLGCVCEGTEVRNSADENVKIYNIKHSHQPI